MSDDEQRMLLGGAHRDDIQRVLLGQSNLTRPAHDAPRRDTAEEVDGQAEVLEVRGRFWSPTAARMLRAYADRLRGDQPPPTPMADHSLQSFVDRLVDRERYSLDEIRHAINEMFPADANVRDDLIELVRAQRPPAPDEPAIIGAGIMATVTRAPEPDLISLAQVEAALTDEVIRNVWFHKNYTCSQSDVLSARVVILAALRAAPERGRTEP